MDHYVMTFVGKETHLKSQAPRFYFYLKLSFLLSLDAYPRAYKTFHALIWLTSLTTLDWSNDT